MSFDAKVSEYVELGTVWAKNHPNRLIKVPATEAGINLNVEDLTANGVNLNVTLIFSETNILLQEMLFGEELKKEQIKIISNLYFLFSYLV